MFKVIRFAKTVLIVGVKITDTTVYLRSRSKLFMWYGMLGGKELLLRTFRNLDQRIRLECDGQVMRLPPLQGVVILNIPR